MAVEAVQKFLEDHNRPFSCIEIQSGAKGEFGKSAIQKALDVLVEKKKVKEKQYGKQKVYCMVQNNKSVNDSKEVLLQIDRQINEHSLHLKEVNDKIKSHSNRMQEIRGKTSIEDAIDRKVKLEKDIDAVKKELEKYADAQLVCPQRKKEVEQLYQRFLNEYKKRKKICNEAIYSIAENYPKGKKALIEDIGIDTDESAGFTISE